MSPADDPRFIELISRYLDASLSREQEAQLLELLQEPRCRERFLELVRLHSEIAGLLSTPIPDDTMAALVLQDIAKEPAEAVLPWEVLRPDPATDRNPAPDSVPAGGITAKGGSATVRLSSARRWIFFFAAAAVVLLGFGLTMFYVARRVEPAASEESKAAKATAQVVAVLTCAVQPEWEGEAPAIGSELRTKERLRLRSGIVQLEFFSGAILVIEGPADFELRGTGRLCCREGRLRARVAPPAEGFTIDSSAVTLVDRGTEFGFHIDRSGRAEVHVFDGKVELHNAAENTLGVDSPQLASGHGISIDPGGVFRKIAADSTAFVSAAKLKQQWHEELQRRHQRWLTQSQKLGADSRLLLYYTFQDQQPWERTLRNRAVVHEGDLNGAIIGCEWSEGRWPGKGALDFKRPSDRVRLQVPGTYQSLTYLAWLRVDSFDQVFSALMLTDGFDEGAPHWQLLNKGSLRLGIKDHRPGHYDYDSSAFLGLDRLGKWLQLATVYDHRSRMVTHYVDGRPVSREGLRFEIALQIGHVEIGNWGRDADPPDPRFEIRNFNGRIDEFALFREALSAEEIARLYESGKASP